MCGAHLPAGDFPLALSLLLPLVFLLGTALDLHAARRQRPHVGLGKPGLMGAGVWRGRWPEAVTMEDRLRSGLLPGQQEDPEAPSACRSRSLPT